eukprot:5305037-Pleurochrysis_carterae.AAC.1
MVDALRRRPAETRRMRRTHVSNVCPWSGRTKIHHLPLHSRIAAFTCLPGRPYVFSRVTCAACGRQSRRRRLVFGITCRVPT